MSLKLCRVLLLQGGLTALHLAALGGNVAMIEHLLGKWPGLLSLRADDGRDALACAVSRHHSQAAACLKRHVAAAAPPAPGPPVSGPAPETDADGPVDSESGLDVVRRCD